MQYKEPKRFDLGMNKDDIPADLQPGEYTDALNQRIASSDEEQGVGMLESIQGEVELIINVSGPTYYGGAIGAEFIYEGFEEVKIGNQVWMKRNLSKVYPGSKAYNDDEMLSLIYGRLYSWQMLQEVDFLPEGWHVPTLDEITELIATLVSADIAGGKMKEPGDTTWILPNTGADDISGFKGLPGGIFSSGFSELGLKANFWTQEDEHQLKDIDNNSYDTISINSKEWIVENLRTIHYSDGSPIQNIKECLFSDWFVPSIDELIEIYNILYLSGIGNYTGAIWSSSEMNSPGHPELNDTYASAVIFLAGGGTRMYYNKDVNYPTVPIRTFTTNDIYALRQKGPANGWIFHIIDNGGGSFTYYETSPILLDHGIIWSNVLTGINTTQDTIGSGGSNTLAIISQVGHEESMASFVNDLEINTWITDLDGAYCWYNNDINNKEIYGALYNWYAATNSKELAYFKRAGIQESGWRVATFDELYELSELCNSLFNALKETGTEYWLDPNLGATDKYGFKLRGAGVRDGYNGSFYGLKSLTQLLGINELDEDSAYYIDSHSESAGSQNGSDLKSFGFSIRCVRDI
jgi:uncharacterized protein (TIGR02145 family)